MADATQQDLGGYGAPKVIADGPFAGWSTWGLGEDPYETHNGPYCFRAQPDGSVRTAYQPKPHQLNGAGAIHGGALASFADFSLFAFAGDALANTMAVTVSLNCEFVGAGDLNGWVEGDGKLIRATRTLIFVQGTLSQRGSTLLAFSGVVKKLGPPKAVG